MASWLHSQLKAAEGLLEAVDQATNKLVGGRDASEAAGEGQPGASPRRVQSSTGRPSSVGRASHTVPGERPRAIGGGQPSSLPAAPEPTLGSVKASNRGLGGPLSTQSTDRFGGNSNPADPGPAGTLPSPGIGHSYKAQWVDRGFPDSPSTGSAQESGSEAGRNPPMGLEASPRADPEGQRGGPGRGDVEGVIPEWSPSPGEKAASQQAASQAIMDLKEEEARELAGSTSGNSREARLMQVVQQLRKRLDDAKSENKQLEDLLLHSDSQATYSTEQGEKLKAKLAAVEKERATSEATYQARVFAQDLELGKLRSDLEASKKWASELESQIVALQSTNTKLMEDHRQNEGRIVEAMGEQLQDMERRLEEASAAHNQAARAAGDREQELQQQMAESTNALSRMQRQLDERNVKILALEELTTGLQSEVHRLSTEGQLDSSKEPVIHDPQVTRLQDQVAALEAELTSTLSVVDGITAEKAAAVDEVTRLQTEMALLKESTDGQNAQMSRQMEYQLREQLELKQAQLERLAAEKGSQQIVYERKISEAQAQVASMRRKLHPDSMPTGSGLDTIIPMDALGDPYDCLVNQRSFGEAIRRAGRLLDSTTSRLLHMVRHYPLWRLGVFLYLIFIHVYCYVLISRLQHRAVALSEAPNGGAVDLLSQNERGRL